MDTENCKDDLSIIANNHKSQSIRYIMEASDPNTDNILRDQQSDLSTNSKIGVMKSFKKKKDWDLVDDLMDRDSLFEVSNLKIPRQTAASQFVKNPVSKKSLLSNTTAKTANVETD